MGAGIGEVFKTVKILLVQRLCQLLVEVEVNNTFNISVKRSHFILSEKPYGKPMVFCVFPKRVGYKMRTRSEIR